MLGIMRWWRQTQNGKPPPYAFIVYFGNPAGNFAFRREYSEILTVSCDNAEICDNQRETSLDHREIDLRVTRRDASGSVASNLADQISWRWKNA